MADDYNRQRARDFSARPQGGAAGNDPLAELARLIGNTDPFSEFGRNAGAAQQPAARVPQPDFAADPYADTRRQAPPFDNVFQPHQPAYQEPSPQPYGVPRLGAGPDLYRSGFEPPPVEPHEAPSYDAQAYYQDSAAQPADPYYDEAPPARRRISIMAIAAIFALAVLGTAGAFGYRALFGSSGSSPPPVIKADTTPSKVVPQNADASGKAITERLGDRGQGERIVPREEQPIDAKDRVAQTAFPNAPQSSMPASGAMPATQSGAGEPKKIRTIAIRPDQSTSATDAPAPTRSAVPAPAPNVPAPQRTSAPSAAEPGPSPIRQIPTTRQAAPNAPASNAPLSLSPDAAPARQAAASPAPRAVAAAPAVAADPSGSYLVQVSSQRSEADAQSALRSLQAKFPGQLGNRPAVVRRADLGDKGTYYRAMVGPFASSEQANELCSSLKSAGGQCIVQKN
jgi:SPOR domain